jgi:hypothetical protein
MIRNEFHTLNYTTFAGKVKCNMQDGKRTVPPKTGGAARIGGGKGGFFKKGS